MVGDDVVAPLPLPRILGIEFCAVDGPLDADLEGVADWDDVCVPGGGVGIEVGSRGAGEVEMVGGVQKGGSHCFGNSEKGWKAEYGVGIR